MVAFDLCKLGRIEGEDYGVINVLNKYPRTKRFDCGCYLEDWGETKRLDFCKKHSINSKSRITVTELENVEN